MDATHEKRGGDITIRLDTDDVAALQAGNVLGTRCTNEPSMEVRVRVGGDISSNTGRVTAMGDVVVNIRDVTSLPLSIGHSLLTAFTAGAEKERSRIFGETGQVLVESSNPFIKILYETKSS